MSEPIDIKSHQILREENGKPVFVVVPYEQYLLMSDQQASLNNRILLPNNVVRKHTLEEKSLLQSWREHLNLTQQDIAKAMQISQSAYSQLESRTNHRASTLEKLAKIMGISPEQLTFED